MSGVFTQQWIIEALVGSTLLMLLVLLVRRPVARLFGAHIAYALWALPALRLVLPPLPGWTSLYLPVAHSGPAYPLVLGLVPHDRAATIAADGAPVVETAMLTAAAHAAPVTVLPVEALPIPPMAGHVDPVVAAVVDGSQMLLILWLGGAALWLAVQLWRTRAFVDAAVADGERLTRIRGIDVILSPRVAGPMAAGIFRRRILLPADFADRYGSDERRLALLHEGAHHDRGDLYANLAGLVVVALHWFNPVAHRAWRAFRHDQEQACDATVLARSSGAERAAYGLTVLKSACPDMPAAALAMNHKAQLKDRIMMMKHRVGRVRLLAGAGVALAGIAGGLLATASGAQPVLPVPPAPPVALVDAPAAPDAPLPPMAPVSPAAPLAPPAPPAPPTPPVTRGEVVIVRDGQTFRYRADSPEGRAAIAEARHAADEARRMARLAAEEGRRAAAEGREAARLGMIEAERGRAEAHRAADEARREAQLAAEEGRRAAADARRHAQWAQGHAERVLAAIDVEGITARAMRAAAVANPCDGGDCRAFEARIKRSVAASLKASRQALLVDRNLTERERAEALRGMDEAIADLEREGR